MLKSMGTLVPPVIRSLIAFSTCEPPQDPPGHYINSGDMGGHTRYAELCGYAVLLSYHTRNAPFQF